MKNMLLPALVWLLALAPALAQSTLAQPASEPQVRVLAPFHAINVGSGILVQLTAGHAQRVEVSAATTEELGRLLTTVANGVLTIRYDNPVEPAAGSKENRQLRVAITADQLMALTAGGGSSVTAAGNFAASDLQLDISSGGSFKASEIALNVLIVRQSSGGNVVLAGYAARFDLRTGSGAIFNGENLQTDHSQVEASSGSSVRLAVNKDLMADASSGAIIRYYGTPELTKNVSSGGSVVNIQHKK